MLNVIKSESVLRFDASLVIFFHSSFNQANLSSQACKDVFHLKNVPDKR